MWLVASRSRCSDKELHDDNDCRRKGKDELVVTHKAQTGIDEQRDGALVRRDRFMHIHSDCEDGVDEEQQQTKCNQK